MHAVLAATDALGEQAGVLQCNSPPRLSGLLLVDPLNFSRAPRDAWKRRPVTHEEVP